MLYSGSSRIARVVFLLLSAEISLGTAKVIEGTLTGQCLINPQEPLKNQIRSTCALPIDEESTLKNGASPWTHQVRCISNGTTNSRGEEIEHCLYTNYLFGAGHGASIITKPEIAAEIIGADALEDRPGYGASGKRSWKPGPIVNKEGPAYIIAPTPGKGLGIVAKRKIHQGEILMLDFPAMIVGKQFLEDIQPLPRRRLLKRGIAQLPEATQKRVLALDRSVGGEAIDDIFGTNTCSVTLNQETHLGLYPEVSRINHACNPNAYYRFSPRALTLEVVAYRDIQPNEEITISYAQLTMSRDARRQFLMTNWHFDCKCSLCRANSDDMTISEDRRRDIRKYQGKLMEATTGGDYHEALDAAEELQKATGAEGVTPLMPEMHDMLAVIYLELKDYSNAKRYGQMALEGWEKFDSVDELQLNMARWFLRHLEGVKKDITAQRDGA